MTNTNELQKLQNKINKLVTDCISEDLIVDLVEDLVTSFFRANDKQFKGLVKKKIESMGDEFILKLAKDALK